jgi:hypothetical protein
MRKIVQVFSCFLILLSSFAFSPSASAMGPEYNSVTGTGDVACGTYGFIAIVNNTVTLNSSCSGTLEIPFGVTTINFAVFSYALGITSVTIPNSVTSIGDQAFYLARNISTINIPNSITSIGADTFGGMLGLTTLTIPNSVTTIGAGAFSNAISITSLTIPNSVTSIGDFAFFGALALTSLTIPNSVTTIGAGAFYDAISLTSVTIPNSVTSIGDFAFYEAISLTSLTIPNSVLNIGEDSFGQSSALTSYQYCGTNISTANLSAAGLGGKTKTCPPLITVPSVPTSITALGSGKQSATVSFDPPASNGGSAITSYSATSSPGGITKTLTQSSGGTFTFDDLQPGTTYTFAISATNAIGTSSATISNSIKTNPLEVASIATLSFVEDVTGTGGKIVWSGKSIDSVLYTGPTNSYPGPFNYGAFTSSWNGTIRNLTPDTSYEISIFAISADGVGETKNLTFKTSATLSTLSGVANSTVTPLSMTKASQLIKWVEENTFVPGEAANMSNLLLKFDALEISPHRAHIKVPTSRVSKVDVKSLTPQACSVVGASAKVDAGLVTALSGDKCSISYTVTGASKAPVTLFKDFFFKKYVK